MLLREFLVNGSVAIAPFILSTLLMDANPSLYVYDKFIANQHHKTKALRGKRIWITGASSGIGCELAKQLSSYGANLILSARDESKLNNIARECRLLQPINSNEKVQQQTQMNNNIYVLPMDVTATNKEIEEKVKYALKHHFQNQGLDILVLNAGRGQLSPALYTDIESSKELMNVNYFGPIQIALSVIKNDGWGKPELSKSNHISNNGNHQQSGDIFHAEKKGHIVVTSSIVAKLGTPLSSSYAGSKHAVHGYFSSLRSEYGKDWLRVDLPCPGPVNTNLSSMAVTATPTETETETITNAGTIPVALKKNQIENHDEKKMTSERCAGLIISSMIGPPSLFYETWIVEQPTLTVMYIAQFFPSLANALLNFVGKIRMRAWKDGLPLYQVNGLLEAWKRTKKDLKKDKIT